MKQGKCIRCSEPFLSRTARRKYCIDCQVIRLHELRKIQDAKKALAKKKISPVVTQEPKQTTDRTLVY